MNDKKGSDSNSLISSDVEPDEREGFSEKKEGVLVMYSGGTIGSAPKDKESPVNTPSTP
jgi:L-asparaginase/Glu-tRNA(Gln) amidotransferase subunit D